MSSHFQPNWASPPGDTIYDILNQKGIELSSFAAEIGISMEVAKDILNGAARITESTAHILSNTLGASVKFWLNREAAYRESLLRIQQLEEQRWLESLPINDMVKLGWIPTVPRSHLLTECLKFFDVPNVETWRIQRSQVYFAAKFKVTTAFESRAESLCAWLRQGEIESSKVDCDRWNKDKFEEVLLEIRQLTREKDPSKFIPHLRQKLAGCGVALVIVRTPKGCPASGATQFRNGKAILQLSFRYLSDDHFWFTLYHEAGHLFLHAQNELFIESDKSNYSESDEEKEANVFAQEMLIPYQYHERLKRLRSNNRDIIQFAMDLGISPGIVVGQMQYQGIISHQYLNKFKRRFDWVSIDAV